MIVTIIGLGLMGGSLAMSLNEVGFSNCIVGVDTNLNHCKEALELNLVNEIKELNDAVLDADIIVVATPVAASINIISDVLEIVSEHQVVVDLGSTKKELCLSFNKHKNRPNYVAAHPIAGTENSGPKAAEKELFKNKKVVVCEKNLSSNNALSIVIEMFNKVGMSTVFMTPDEHDRHLAYISHLSHISSFALGLTVLDLEKDEENIFNLAGSGFSSTARLAKSSPEMWNAIISQNKENVLPALDAYIDYLNAFRKDIIDENEEELKMKMISANKIRKIIKE
jgi:prephenate dehydrogenase